MGGAGRWVREFPQVRGGLQEIRSEGRDAARDHYRAAADGTAVSGRRLLESVSAHAGVGICALRGTGQERASVHGADGDRRAGQAAAGNRGGAERAAADGSGVEPGLGEEESGRGGAVEELTLALPRRTGYLLLGREAGGTNPLAR